MAYTLCVYTVNHLFVSHFIAIRCWNCKTKTNECWL